MSVKSSPTDEKGIFMQPNSQADYKKLLTEIIRKQMVVLGPSITLVKARNVEGLTVEDDGTVTKVYQEPQLVIQNLISEFAELSEFIVKKTIEPLLANYSKRIGSISLKSEFPPEMPPPSEPSAPQSKPEPKNNNQQTKQT